jgi:integrase
MGRNKLTDTFIRNAKPGKHYDGGGLIFERKPSKTASFLYRYTFQGKERSMGLGAYPILTLAKARQNRDDWERSLKLDGLDPIRERAKQRTEATIDDNTLSVITYKAYEAKKAGLKNGGPNWLSAVEKHILPQLGHILITEINQQDVHRVLHPIWNTKHETAKRALVRLGIILKYAAAMGKEIDINLTDKVRALLGSTTHQSKHHAAVPFADVPALYQSIPENKLKYLALKFSILVPNVRTTPIRLLKLSDISERIWTVPKEDLKSRLNKTDDSQIILSDEAIRIIDLARPYSKNNYLFASRNGGPMAEVTMLRTLGEITTGATIHGFRSSLSTWLEEQSNVPENLKKSLLSHKVGNNAVEAAYNRNKYVEPRRRIMNLWADHCLSTSGEVVVPIREAK